MQLRDEAMTLLVAGQETSAILLGWAAALLAHHPEAQAAAAEEAAAVLGAGAAAGEGAALPGAKDLARLPKVTAVVLEALRLHSPAYMVGRCASRAAGLAGGFSLPQGTTVLVSPYLLHRDPDHWREPLRFAPERWAGVLEAQPPQQQHQPGQPGEQQPGEQQPGEQQPGEQQQQQQPAQQQQSSGGGGYPFATALRELGPNGAYVPFGGGPRNCIGTGFAMMEAILVLAALLARYELRPAPGARFPRARALLTLRPEGVPVRVLPRRAAAARR